MLTAKNWNSIIGDIGVKSGMTNFVAAFGFEIDIRKFSPEKEVLRLYVFYNNSLSNEEHVLKKFLCLLKERYPEIHSRMGVVGSGKTGFKHIKKNPNYDDYFFAIEKVDSEKEILDCYSSYIAGSLYLIATEELPEFSRIEINSLARLRIRQLFWICCCIYPELSKNCKSIISKLSYRSVGVDPTIEVNSESEIKEILLIRDKCKKFIEETISSKEISIDVFAGGGKQKIFIDEDRFFAAKNKVKKSYERFYA